MHASIAAVWRNGGYGDIYVVDPSDNIAYTATESPVAYQYRHGVPGMLLDLEETNFEFQPAGFDPQTLVFVLTEQQRLEKTPDVGEQMPVVERFPQRVDP